MSFENLSQTPSIRCTKMFLKSDVGMKKRNSINFHMRKRVSTLRDCAWDHNGLAIHHNSLSSYRHVIRIRSYINNCTFIPWYFMYVCNARKPRQRRGKNDRCLYTWCMMWVSALCSTQLNDVRDFIYRSRLHFIDFEKSPLKNSLQLYWAFPLNARCVVGEKVKGD